MHQRVELSSCPLIWSHGSGSHGRGSIAEGGGGTKHHLYAGSQASNVFMPGSLDEAPASDHCILINDVLQQQLDFHSPRVLRGSGSLVLINGLGC